MERHFEKSQWIWKRDGSAFDDYAEFAGTFFCPDRHAVFIDLSADSNCNVYVNGELVFFKQFADYPWAKSFDRVDISRFCRQENEIRIAVWYYGTGNASYYPSTPGLIFEIRQGGKLLLGSDETIQSRTDNRYAIGYGKRITQQLGFSFAFDCGADHALPWGSSMLVDKPKPLRQNPLKQLQLGDRVPARILRQDHGCALIDLGREECGFLDLELVSPAVQKVAIAYGEHIAGGAVRRLIHDRDFSVEIRLAKGKNVCTNTFRRLAGRYLEIFYEEPVQIAYLGLRPVVYPARAIGFAAANDLQQRIYDTAVRTLQLSMHEHYEDCPWREQAMYVMDSRNQMLCGYHCFDNGDYARENLILMAQGVREDGLLELTYPAKDTPAIPFFSLMYPVAVEEYVRHTDDGTILKAVGPVVERIIQAFQSRIGKEGLIANLPHPYWNFYEWSEGSAHEEQIHRDPGAPDQKQFDLILNCAFLLAADSADRLAGRQTDRSALKKAVHDTFYDERVGMYAAGTAQPTLYTALGNSLAILSGAADSVKDRLAGKLQVGADMVPVTLSMGCFRYDALLSVSRDYGPWVIRDLETVYGKMLHAGATSFWETEKGEQDFDNAGSLCHGWSAMPIYYFNLLKTE